MAMDSVVQSTTVYYVIWILIALGRDVFVELVSMVMDMSVNQTISKEHFVQNVIQKLIALVEAASVKEVSMVTGINVGLYQ